jgi:hypothetical protein
VTPAAGVTYTGWKAGVGTEPTTCDATGVTSTPPTTVTAPADGSRTVWVVDTITPTGSTSAARTSATGLGLSFHWNATDTSPSSGIAHYSVTVTHHGSSTPDYQALSTHATSVTLTGRPGRTYTARVIATDHAGNTSKPRTATVTLPFDERKLSFSHHWTHASASRAFLHTLTTTHTRGASGQLTVTGHAYAVLVTTCSSCGHLTEYVDGHRIRTISLRTSARHYRVPFTIATFATDGRHTVKLVDAGGHVELDALRVLI